MEDTYKVNSLHNENKMSLKKLNIDHSLIKEGLLVQDDKQIDKILHALLQEVVNNKIVNKTDTLLVKAYELRDI